MKHFLSNDHVTVFNNDEHKTFLSNEHENF